MKDRNYISKYNSKYWVFELKTVDSETINLPTTIYCYCYGSYVEHLCCRLEGDIIEIKDGNFKFMKGCDFLNEASIYQYYSEKEITQDEYNLFIDDFIKNYKL